MKSFTLARILIAFMLHTLLLPVTSFAGSKPPSECSKRLHYSEGQEARWLQTPVYKKNSFLYEAHDPRYPDKYYFRAKLIGSELSFDVRSLVRGQRSRYIYAKKEFQRAVEHFGRDNIKSVRLLWVSPRILGEPEDYIETNLRQFNQFLLDNPEAGFVAAAKSTWSGQRCLELGFNQFQVFTNEDTEFARSDSVKVICTRD